MIHSLSLVVATKDRPDDLRKMLNSLQDQGIHPAEIIVVDASLEPVEAVLKDFPGLPLRYLRHMPPSAAAQRNAGIQACSPSATLIGFADDDITFEPKAFEHLLNFWDNASPDTLGAAFNLRNYPHRGPSVLKHSRIAEAFGLYSSRPGTVSPSGWQSVVPGLIETEFVDWLPTTAVTFRKETFKLGLFDDFYESYSYLEDLDFSYTISRNGRLAVVADAGFGHFPSPSGRVTLFQFGRFEVRNRLHFVRKHGLSLSRCYVGLTLRMAMSVGSGITRINPGLLKRALGNLLELVAGTGRSHSNGPQKVSASLNRSLHSPAYRTTDAPSQRMMNRPRGSRKTVGVFMTFLSSIRGGADVTAMWLIQALCAHYDVTLVTTSQFDLDFFNRFAGTQLHQNQFSTRLVRLFPTPEAFPMSAMQEPLFQRSARSCSSEFDLCVSPMNPLDLGVPAVHFVTDFERLLETDQALQSSTASAHRRDVSALRRIYHAASARIQDSSGRDLLRDDVLVSNSEWVASSLRTMGIESPVIYPPVPWISQDNDWDSRNKDFVWFGRIAPQKKVEEAINIVARLRNTGMECSLHIAGTAVDKDYLRFIRDLAKRMGDWVVLRGPIYGEDKAAFLTQFRYALHTRADEPFGITLVELMKAGCIPFAPDSCGSAEILNHPAVLYSNEDQAVTRIRELLSDPWLCQSVRSSLRQRAGFFSTERFCESALTLVSDILHEGAYSQPEIRLSRSHTNSGRIGNHGT